MPAPDRPGVTGRRRVPRVWRYCPLCALELASVSGADGVTRPTCRGCGFVRHGPEIRRDVTTGKPTFTVGAFAVVFDADGAVLLGHRADRDLWTLPGGVVEHGETPWAAAVRETREETGIDVEPMRLAIVDWKTQLADVVFVFECRMIGGTLGTSAETSEVGFFAPSAYPATLPQRLVERIEHVRGSEAAVILRETPGFP